MRARRAGARRTGVGVRRAGLGPRRAGVLGLVAAAALIVPLAGCTQVAQLKGVAGGQVTAVRTATNDVLVTKKVPIGVAPVCELQDPIYVCVGSTKTGQEIRSEATVLAAYGVTKDEFGAPVPADVSLVVTVGGRQIFDGKVQDVLDENGQVAK